MRRIDLRKAQAARSSTIRVINRRIVLNCVRERELISRASSLPARRRNMSNCESVRLFVEGF
jgi:hypothetical protein